MSYVEAEDVIFVDKSEDQWLTVGSWTEFYVDNAIIEGGPEGIRRQARNLRIIPDSVKSQNPAHSCCDPIPDLRANWKMTKWIVMNFKKTLRFKTSWYFPAYDDRRNYLVNSALVCSNFIDATLDSSDWKLLDEHNVREFDASAELTNVAHEDSARVWRIVTYYYNGEEFSLSGMLSKMGKLSHTRAGRVVPRFQVNLPPDVLRTSGMKTGSIFSVYRTDESLERQTRTRNTRTIAALATGLLKMGGGDEFSDKPFEQFSEANPAATADFQRNGFDHSNYTDSAPRAEPEFRFRDTSRDMASRDVRKFSHSFSERARLQELPVRTNSALTPSNAESRFMPSRNVPVRQFGEFAISSSERHLFGEPPSSSIVVSAPSNERNRFFSSTGRMGQEAETRGEAPLGRFEERPNFRLHETNPAHPSWYIANKDRSSNLNQEFGSDQKFTEVDLSAKSDTKFGQPPKLTAFNFDSLRKQSNEPAGCETIMHSASKSDGATAGTTAGSMPLTERREEKGKEEGNNKEERLVETSKGECEEEKFVGFGRSMRPHVNRMNIPKYSSKGSTLTFSTTVRDSNSTRVATQPVTNPRPRRHIPSSMSVGNGWPVDSGASSSSSATSVSSAAPAAASVRHSTVSSVPPVVVREFPQRPRAHEKTPQTKVPEVFENLESKDGALASFVTVHDSNSPRSGTQASSPRCGESSSMSFSNGWPVDSGVASSATSAVSIPQSAFPSAAPVVVREFPQRPRVPVNTQQTKVPENPEDSEDEFDIDNMSREEAIRLMELLNTVAGVDAIAEREGTTAELAVVRQMVQRIRLLRQSE